MSIFTIQVDNPATGEGDQILRYPVNGDLIPNGSFSVETGYKIDGIKRCGGYVWAFVSSNPAVTPLQYEYNYYKRLYQIDESTMLSVNSWDLSTELTQIATYDFGLPLLKDTYNYALSAGSIADNSGFKHNDTLIINVEQSGDDFIIYVQCVAYYHSPGTVIMGITFGAGNWAYPQLLKYTITGSNISYNGSWVMDKVDAETEYRFGQISHNYPFEPIFYNGDMYILNVGGRGDAGNYSYISDTTSVRQIIKISLSNLGANNLPPESPTIKTIVYSEGYNIVGFGLVKDRIWIVEVTGLGIRVKRIVPSNGAIESTQDYACKADSSNPIHGLNVTYDPNTDEAFVLNYYYTAPAHTNIMIIDGTTYDLKGFIFLQLPEDSLMRIANGRLSICQDAQEYLLLEANNDFNATTGQQSNKKLYKIDRTALTSVIDGVSYSVKSSQNTWEPSGNPPRGWTSRRGDWDALLNPISTWSRGFRPQKMRITLSNWDGTECTNPFDISLYSGKNYSRMHLLSSYYGNITTFVSGEEISLDWSDANDSHLWDIGMLDIYGDLGTDPDNTIVSNIEFSLGEATVPSVEEIPISPYVLPNKPDGFTTVSTIGGSDRLCTIYVPTAFNPLQFFACVSYDSVTWGAQTYRSTGTSGVLAVTPIKWTGSEFIILAKCSDGIHIITSINGTTDWSDKGTINTILQYSYNSDPIRIGSNIIIPIIHYMTVIVGILNDSGSVSFSPVTGVTEQEAAGTPFTATNGTDLVVSTSYRLFRSTSFPFDSWETNSSSLGLYYYNKIYYVNGKYVTVGRSISGNPQGYLYGHIYPVTSVNGLDWTVHSPIVLSREDYTDNIGYISNFLYDGTKFILTTTSYRMFFSLDGIDWTEVVIPYDAYTDAIENWDYYIEGSATENGLSLFKTYDLNYFSFTQPEPPPII